MESGSSLSPNQSAIIIAFIQLLGSIASILIVERIQRKLLYSLSCFGTVLGLICFGMHGLVMTLMEIENINWIPIASMSFVIFIASVGIMPLTFTILSEVLPLKVNLNFQLLSDFF